MVESLTSNPRVVGVSLSLFRISSVKAVSSGKVAPFSCNGHLSTDYVALDNCNTELSIVIIVSHCSLSTNIMYCLYVHVSMCINMCTHWYKANILYERNTVEIMLKQPK